MYRVKWLQDDIYQVYNVESCETVFQGSINECEAYIRLRNRNLLD